MFDVIWTDPNRELMGERIIRKEQEAKTREKQKRQRSESSRRSVSTESSASRASSERGFGLFASRSRRKIPSPPKSGDPATPPTLLTSSTSKASRTSAYGVRALLLQHQDNSEATVKPDEAAHLPVQPQEAAEVSSLSSPDSTLSKWTQPSAVSNGTSAGASVSDPATAPKPEHLIQTLGPSSFITRTTEVTYSTRDPDTDIDQLVSEVHISADQKKPQTPPLPDVPETSNPLAFDDPGSAASPIQSPLTPPPVEHRNNEGVYTPGWNGNDRLGNPDAWKPPHEWNCTPTKENATRADEEKLYNSLTSDDSDQCMSPGLAALQREVRMMAAAEPELMLANIKSSMGHSSDGMVYKELESTKKRWLFSALQHEGYVLLGECVDKCLRSPDSSNSPRSPRSPRILALYETPASASFLAALHPQALISHLSQEPISPSLFPNVHPILVPAVSASAGSRPLAPQLYSAVTCLRMPALFPSSEIPPLLRHIYRCLAPGGALYLTLIDPQPVSSSMGPKLRQWLIDNLLIQLEKRFRTTFPSGTFPAWLAVAKLRGLGSSITTVTVRAVHEREGNATSDDSKDRASVQRELRCLTARMLWREIWGNDVHAKRWWWEEEDIIQECIEKGTQWQYSHIVAVKGKKQTS
ncbi:hypothetical protein Hte_006783 [Hypoxylon texense]